MGSRTFDLDRYLADLETLVNVDSKSRDLAGLERVADLLSARFAEAGFETTRHVFDEAAGPCLEVRSSQADTFDALVVGHIDTVFPAGTVAERPFSIVDGRAHGPGVADMKSGLLLALNAMEQLRAEGRLGSVCMAINPDEEVGSRSSKDWIGGLAERSRHAFVMEPARANGALVLERKGGEVFTVELTGVAAHAGVEPEKGRSAVVELAHWILGLHDLVDPDVETSVNVGLASGGTASNVVAAAARAVVDVRYWSEAEASRVGKAVQALLAAPKVEGVAARLEGRNARPPMVPTEETRALCATIEQVGREVGVEVTWARTGGGSDGNTTAARGTPTVDGLGPVGGNCHRPDEYLEIDSIEPRLRLFAETLAAVAPPRGSPA